MSLSLNESRNGFSMARIAAWLLCLCACLVGSVDAFANETSPKPKPASSPFSEKSGEKTSSLAVITLAVDGCEQSDIGEYANQLRNALIQKGAQVQTEKDTVEALGGASSLSQAEIERNAAAFVENMSQMQYDRMIKNIPPLIGQLHSMPPSKERCEALRDLYLKAAWAFRKLDQEPECLANIEKITRADSVKVEYKLFPPSFQSTVASVRAANRKKASSEIYVVTEPAGPTVYIDGCPVGNSPLRMKLPAARYRVDVGFVESKHCLPKIVSVEGEETRVQFEEGFEGAVFAEKTCVGFGRDKQNQIKSLTRLGSILGVGSIAALRLRQDESKKGERYLTVTLVENGVETREARVKLSPGAGVGAEGIEKLSEFIWSGQILPPLEPMPSGRGFFLDDSQEQQSKKKWVKAEKIAGFALGAIAIGLTVGALVENSRVGKLSREKASLGDDAGSNYRKSELSDRISSASNWRTGLAIGAGAAALGSGTCLVFGFYQHKNTGDASSKNVGISLALGGSF